MTAKACTRSASCPTSSGNGPGRLPATHRPSTANPVPSNASRPKLAIAARFPSATAFTSAMPTARPYVECGTTCYAWAFQAEDTQRQTIETLTASPFNKMRMCVFPKWYQHNRKEPPMYPFPRNGEVNDYSTFNRILPALRPSHPRASAASASRPISSSFIPTTSGAISRCPPKWTTAISAT